MNNRKVIPRIMRVCQSWLIQFKLVFPGIVFFQGWLVRLGHNEILYYQVVHFGTHKTAVGIFRGADNRLATDIE